MIRVSFFVVADAVTMMKDAQNFNGISNDQFIGLCNCHQCTGIAGKISFDGAGYAFYVAVTALNGAGESGYSNISFFDLE